jgi:hypothetical protein
MIMGKYLIEKDWDNHNTRDACIDFLFWRKDWGVTLLQIESFMLMNLEEILKKLLIFNLKV